MRRAGSQTVALLTLSLALLGGAQAGGVRISGIKDLACLNGHDMPHGCLFTRDDSSQVCYVNLETGSDYNVASTNLLSTEGPDGEQSIAGFDQPQGIVVTTDFSLAFVVDRGNARTVSLDLKTHRDGDISLLSAGVVSSFKSYADPSYIALLSSKDGGCLYTTLNTMGTVARHCSEGDASNYVLPPEELTQPHGIVAQIGAHSLVATDQRGDTGRSRIVRIEPSPTNSSYTVLYDSADGSVFEGITALSSDRYVLTDRGTHRIYIYEEAKNLLQFVAGGSGGGFKDGRGPNALFDTPHGISNYDTVSVVVADTGNNKLRRVWISGDKYGRVETLATFGNRTLCPEFKLGGWEESGDSESDDDSSTGAPSRSPTPKPVWHPYPTPAPSVVPPTQKPTDHPVHEPTAKPTLFPTPTPLPTPQGPTLRPTSSTPTMLPTPTTPPTLSPNPNPTVPKTDHPVPAPTASPSTKPSPSPTVHKKPSLAPTQKPTEFPIATPTARPSAAATLHPVPQPTSAADTNVVLTTDDTLPSDDTSAVPGVVTDDAAAIPDVVTQTDDAIFVPASDDALAILTDDPNMFTDESDPLTQTDEPTLVISDDPVSNPNTQSAADGAPTSDANVDGDDGSSTHSHSSHHSRSGSSSHSSSSSRSSRSSRSSHSSRSSSTHSKSSGDDGDDAVSALTSLDDAPAVITSSSDDGPAASISSAGQPIETDDETSTTSRSKSKRSKSGSKHSSSSSSSISDDGDDDDGSSSNKGHKKIHHTVAVVRSEETLVADRGDRDHAAAGAPEYAAPALAAAGLTVMALAVAVAVRDRIGGRRRTSGYTEVSSAFLEDA